MGPDSDIDRLVIKAGKFNRWRLTTAIYRHLRGVGASVDVVVVTPDEVEQYGDSPYLVIHPALTEGKVLERFAHALLTAFKGYRCDHTFSPREKEIVPRPYATQW